jgi:hypothetical protein
VAFNPKQNVRKEMMEDTAMEITAILAFLAANWETISVIILGCVALWYKVKDMAAEKGGLAMTAAIEEFAALAKGAVAPKDVKAMVSKAKGFSALATWFINGLVAKTDPKPKGKAGGK